ncbi:PAS domain S-box-containing protein [Methylobacterium sp. yr668]|nr:PAS domain-containing protein [Methylobacterium sp. yr668]SFT25145.1 PAS domain S-box-containing protein [Methylobacterium sp. yr668]
MAASKPLDGQTASETFQTALDALDVVGRWEWDAGVDRVRADAFVALVYNVDPAEAEEGVPLGRYMSSIHADDRERIDDLIRRSARDGTPYLAEHRVTSADGRTRWVLVRGRFTGDHVGRPRGGSGILLDITRMRMFEDMADEAVPRVETSPLELAADHAIAAMYAISELRDAELKVQAEALLMTLGRRLALQEVQDRHRQMN